MLFYVIRQRDEGRLIARHSFNINRSVVHGDLRMVEERDPVLRRTCLMARLKAPDQPLTELLPPLKDATLLYMDHSRLVIAGFEQILDRDYAQTWMLTLDTEAMHSLQINSGQR